MKVYAPDKASLRWSILKKPALTLAVSAGLLILQTATVSAAAIYDAIATSTITILDDGGLLGMSDPFSPPIFFDTASSGSGVALGTGSVVPGALVPVGTGSVISQVADVSGSATAPGDTAFSEVMTTALISFDNPTDMPITITFGVEYSLFAMTGIADPLIESAFASAAFGLKDLTGAPVFMDVIAAPPGGGATATGLVVLLPIDVIVAPFSSNGLTVGADAIGSAVAVSEPANLTLFAFALAALGLARRRQNRH